MPIESIMPQWVAVVVPIVVVWDLVWRGMAMWRAGRRNEPVWFVCLLVFNTIGILPIIYLLIAGAAAGQDPASTVQA